MHANFFGRRLGLCFLCLLNICHGGISICVCIYRISRNSSCNRTGFAGNKSSCTLCFPELSILAFINPFFLVSPIRLSPPAAAVGVDRGGSLPGRPCRRGSRRLLPQPPTAGVHGRVGADLVDSLPIRLYDFIPPLFFF